MRGVRDQAIWLAIAFLFCLAAPPAQSTSFGPYAVFFDAGSTRIDPQGRQILDNFIVAWKQIPPGLVLVSGHADRTGSEEANLRLSCARARDVAAYLIAHGLPEERIRLVGRGERQGLVETADGIAKAENRFVQVIFLSPGNEPEDALC